MFAVILSHKTTPPGILIVHETQEPVLVGDTPLSTKLLNDYVKGIRFYVYDTKMCKKRENIILAKSLDKFIQMGSIYYKYADMTLDKKPFLDKREIEINNIVYKLKEIIK
jgi:hypothetical protein